MNQERILAARKKLKEFQRQKVEKPVQNASEETAPQKFSDDRRTSLESHDSFGQHHESCGELKRNNGNNNQLELKTDSESPHFFSNENHIQFSPTPSLPEKSHNPNTHLEHESMNGTPPYNFTPQHSRNESSSTTSSQMVPENIDQQNSQGQSFTNSIQELNIPNNTSSSLQKEHLLQMANAVANVLVDNEGLDESTLNNCDLEQRNQFLTCCLEEQKKLVNQLHIQVSQSNSRISELEAILNTKNTEFESRLIREINPLKEQIQLDAQTIGILVGEKAELTATNAQCQAIIKQKTDEVGDLYGKLKNSHHRVVELEKELANVKNNMESLSQSYEQFQKTYEEAIEKAAKLKKENEENELETSELRQKLNYKNTEIASLQQEVQEKIALLSLSELRMQQMSQSPQEMNSLETQHHTTKMLEQQLSRMKEALDSISGEKDEVSKKFQSYVQQLDERHTSLVAELEASKKVIEESEIREQSYIQRLSELEQQLQREKEKEKPPLTPVEDKSEKIELLTKSMDNLVLEQENLQSLINEKDNEIEVLKKELQELQDMREQSVEATKLVSALQSEQLGASRAVSQNQQLKIQLDEMHDAFIALSNSKLDLTEQLQAERTIGKKLNAQLNDVESQLDEIKHELEKKDTALVELQKEKLHAAQIEDQIQHYQAQSHSANTLQQELQNALMTIESLKKENQLLQTKLSSFENTSSIVETTQENNQTISENVITNGPDATDNVNHHIIDSKDNMKENISKVETSKLQSPSSSEYNQIANVTEAMRKLEERFKQTMDKVAELTDEKQRLEHLVLQLQGETETIGEYVTLYQKQRSILQAKAKEREETFRQLLDQRNQMQEQLHRLKVLVADLLKSKNSSANVSTATVAEENMALSDQPVENESNNIEVIEGHVNKTEEIIPQQPDSTTSQILDLLTEIKDCNDTCFMEPNFHPCPWCSGKLITV